MKIMQTTIERLLYLNLLLVFLLIGIGVYYFHTTLQTVQANQATQTEATKIYINCLLKITPKDNLSAQEQACFNTAPKVKS